MPKLKIASDIVNESQFLLYQDSNGVTNVNVRFESNDIWLAQPQIAELFDISC